jgi:large subunit ribosomal protein L17
MVAGRQLGRNINQRKSLFKSLINSLIQGEEIKTTQAKAKAIQGLFDKLVTRGKLGTIHARRLLHAFLQDKSSVNKLVDELVPRFGTRPSGFTSITKLGRRRGDNAEVVKIALVDPKVEEPKTKEPKVKAAAKKTTVSKKVSEK